MRIKTFFQTGLFVVAGFISGCDSSLLDKGSEHSNEKNLLRPQDLGISKYVFTVSHKEDEVGVFSVTYPSINSSDSSEINYRTYNIYISSKDGIASESITVINKSLLASSGGGEGRGTHGNDYYVNLGNGFGVDLNNYYLSESRYDNTSGEIRFGRQESFGEDLSDKILFKFEMKAVQKDKINGIDPDLLSREAPWKHSTETKAGAAVNASAAASSSENHLYD